MQRELSPREQQEDKAGFGVPGKEKPLTILAQPGLPVPAQDGMNWDSPVTCAERGTPAPCKRLKNVTISGHDRVRKALLPCSSSAGIPQSLSTECVEMQPAPATVRASLGTTELLGG